MRTALQDLTPKGNRRKKSQAFLDAAEAHQPPATPAKPPTGRRGDFQGNVYAAHYRTHQGTMRELRRGGASGRGMEKPMRSRIQRSRRKQRTGGVK